MQSRTHLAIVVGLAYLAVVDVTVGVWALVNPLSFFRSFPGLGQHWVAAVPPYNHHLVIDAGAGFFGVGIVVALAAWWGERRLVQAAAIGSLAHDLPHFLFHLLHPSSVLSSFARAANTGGLAFSCLVGASVLAVATASGSIDATTERAVVGLSHG
jgi:hypothetical protein